MCQGNGEVTAAHPFCIILQKDRLYFAIPLCPDGETFLQKQDLFQGESSFEQEQSIKSFEEEIPNFDSGKDDRNDTWL